MSAPRQDDVDPAARVRQLLVSGDNIIKNREDPERYERARERYEKARGVARAADLASVLPLIELRLAEMPTAGERA